MASSPPQPPSGVTAPTGEVVRPGEGGGADRSSEETWSGLGRGERLTILALALVSLLLRAFAFFNYRFDSDEPQHLHVAWGWTAGLVQYRDFFDNHAPLFQMLSAPLLALVGERPDVLLYMRLSMVPLFAVVVGASYILARRLYSQRIALWTAVILSLTTVFFLKSLEYRTDNLWNALWMVALLVLTGPPLGTRRLFFTGLILGIALCVSLKTTLLVITLGGAALITYASCQRRPPMARIVRLALAGLAGFAIAPAIVSAYFVWKGAWPSLVYCNFTFHELVAQTRDRVWIGRAIYPVALALLMYAARATSRVREPQGVAGWRFYFAVALGVFILTLGGFWMIISVRDSLPITPLATMFLVAAVVHGRRTRPHLLPLLAGIGLVCAEVTMAYGEPFRNQTGEQIAMTRQVLGLTRPGEPIMDLKGETIFRPRPFYNIFETITRAAVRKGLIRDTIPESVIAARCHVALPDSRFIPTRARQFLSENFLDVGRLRASGQWIAEDGSFSIAVEGRYVILTRRGEPQGLLDGTPYEGPRMLSRGRHSFAGAGRTTRKAVLWAPAYSRGYSPFHPRDERI